MVMAVLTVNVAVRNLFLAGDAYVSHSRRKVQCLARMRVVTVENDLTALDLHHSKDL